MNTPLDLETLNKLIELVEAEKHKHWISGVPRQDGVAEVYSPSDGPLRVIVPLLETEGTRAEMLARVFTRLPEILDMAKRWLLLLELEDIVTKSNGLRLEVQDAVEHVNFQMEEESKKRQ